MGSITVLATPCSGDDAISLASYDVPVNSGWMIKKGRIFPSWRARYFELFPSGKLIYYTDEDKQTRKGIADFSIITGFNQPDDKSFEVITPHRTWCFECVSSDECLFWIETIEMVRESQRQHRLLSVSGDLVELGLAIFSGPSSSCSSTSDLESFASKQFEPSTRERRDGVFEDKLLEDLWAE